jgi:hypothetical protein
MGFIEEEDIMRLIEEMLTGLLPVVARLKQRFRVREMCVLADRGMISKHTMLGWKDPRTSRRHAGKIDGRSGYRYRI